MVMMKTLSFAERHFKWNAMVRMNLLVYQNFSLGVFLNIAKGYEASGKAVLKVSYVLAWIGILVIYCNAYVMYYLVEKYFRQNQSKV
jgi:hypothetical protein